MNATPGERLQRLLRHAVQGWQRATTDPASRQRARVWLTAHPSAMQGVDDLWLAALDGRGPLADWLASGARESDWQQPLPLHSVLACHPFPDLPQWTELPK